MSEDPFDTASPRPPRVWGDKSDIHVPGAGAMGMTLLLASLSMIFGATMILFILFRFAGIGGQWKASLVSLPGSLWVSTALILISSGTMHRAYRAVQNDNEKSLVKMLAVTLVLGIAFLLLQSVNWYDVYAQLVAKQEPHTFAIAFFYIFTFVHAAHVIGGLIPMAITLMKARRGVYSRNFHPGVRYTMIYWHFLAIMWVLLFALMVAT